MVWEMSQRFKRVYPFYVRNGLVWEKTELIWLRHFLREIRSRSLMPLKVVDLSLKDIYPIHWSLTGRGTPSHTTQDAAVYLPGRNLILISKAAVYAMLQDIDVLALGVLKGNPFPDSSKGFLKNLSRAIGVGLNHPLTILTPYSGMGKDEVMKRGNGLPLPLTFSCISPKKNRHCGACNKCAERILAFRRLGLQDTTRYHRTVV